MILCNPIKYRDSAPLIKKTLPKEFMDIIMMEHIGRKKKAREVAFIEVLEAKL